MNAAPHKRTRIHYCGFIAPTAAAIFFTSTEPATRIRQTFTRLILVSPANPRATNWPINDHLTRSVRGTKMSAYVVEHKTINKILAILQTSDLKHELESIFHPFGYTVEAAE
jgi:hypothetical protein